MADDDSGAPVFRDGDLLVVSPHATLRRGHRAVLRSISGRMRLYEFLRRAPGKIEVRAFDGEKRTHEAREIVFAHRIVWASQ